MLRRLRKHGQSTGEYAIVFALVLGGLVVMQTYLRGSMQKSLKGTADYLVKDTVATMISSVAGPDFVESDAQTRLVMRAGRQTTDTAENTQVNQYDGISEYQYGDETRAGSYYSSTEQEATTTGGSGLDFGAQPR